MKTSSLATLLLSALLVAGCGSGAVSLSARTGAPRTGTGTGALQQALTLNDGIVINRLRMVIRQVELEREAEEDGEELEQGPYLIDLDGTELEAQSNALFSVAVPAGSYSQLEFLVQKPNDDEGKTAAFAEMWKAEASIIVDGTIDGAAFSFATGLDEKQEVEGKITVGDGADNVTLNLDVTRWFKNGSGQRLDPRDAGSKSQIEANIRASIDAYEDDDSDGEQDD